MIDKKNIDLHIHSSSSDGKFSAEKIPFLAKKAGLSTIALTDHDTIHGLYDFEKAGLNECIETISGVEIEVNNVKRKFIEIHILGLFIDKTNVKLNKLLDFSLNERINQKKIIIDNLRKLGYNITFDEVNSIVQSEIGRPHIAKILLQKYPKKFNSISNVFEKLIGTGMPAFSPRLKLVSFEETTV